MDSWPFVATSCWVYPFAVERLRPMCGNRLTDIGLNVRAVNSLEDAGIFTVDQLVQQTEWDVRLIRNIGRGTFESIRRALKAHGLRLASDPQPWGGVDF